YEWTSSSLPLPEHRLACPVPSVDLSDAVSRSGRPVPGRSLIVRRAKLDRGVLRKRTSLELTAGDQDAGAGRQVDRVRAEIHDADEAFATCEGEDRAGGREPLQAAVAEPGSGPAQPQARAVEGEHRRRHLRLGSDGESAPVVGLVEPGPVRALSAESVRLPIAGPGQRVTAYGATGSAFTISYPHRV